MFFNRDIDFLPFKEKSNVYIVADFDKTITKGLSNSSWSVFALSGRLPISYSEERKNLFNYYRPIEIDEEFDPEKKMILMQEWTVKLLELFKKYNVSEEDFNDIINTTKELELRDGVFEFLEFLNLHNIPLIIISAGVGNVIEKFLMRNNCLFDNIYIASNFIEFKDGKFDKIRDGLIHSLNKNEVVFPNDILDKINARNNVVLIGDQTTDINMVSDFNKNVLSIGLFIDEKITTIDALNKTFDIVLNSEENYFTLLKLLF
ncbi:MAG: haloacid dehalogenase-like hydrolase [Clostridia bacterium]|nr:haloacid dehalogenase-like hydrolase [Clostridia bacterium]